MARGGTILTGTETRSAGRAVRPATRRTVVEPARPGPSSRIGALVPARRPWLAFWSAGLAGYALLAGLVVAVGLLLTRVLLHVGAVARADERVPSWMARHREGWLTTVSDAASRAGDVPVLPVLVGVVLVVALVVRRARVGVFLTTAILMEVTLYRIGALAAPRERPAVPRLDALPADESFPSGHVAASTVVYAGLALLVASAVRRGWATATAWAVAVLVVLAVAAARMYRGMHHPLDTLSGALLGAGCLAVALVAVRAYGHVRRRRERAAGGERRADR